MENTIEVAKYFNELYIRDHDGEHIDEMRLQKLMYFAQKESLKKSSVPLFRGPIKGWRLGPVVPSVHGAIKKIGFFENPSQVSDDSRQLLQEIYEKYKNLSSIELNNLTHKEFSWMKSRDGKNSGEQGKETITLDEIRVDVLIEELEEKMGEIDYELYV